MSNVIYLHGQPTPVARFLRVTEHRRLDQLLEADKLPYERFVVEAGYRGFEDTIKDPKGHFLRQRALQCDAISAVPEPVRPGHFLDKDLTEADRRARLLAKLELSDKLSSLVVENAKRVDRFRDVLGNLEKTSASATRSPGFPSAAANREAGKDRR